MGTSELDDFPAFYRRTYAAAFRTALGITASRSLAEDATQEAYTSAYRDSSSFRSEAPPEHWLQRIVVRKAIDQLRRRKGTRTIELTPDTEPEPQDPPNIVQRLALLAALDELEPRQRAAIVLRYFHDYSHRDVGTALGISESGAAMLVSRALGRLRIELTERPDPAPLASKDGGSA